MKKHLVFTSFVFAILFVLSPIKVAATSILVSNNITDGVVRTDIYYGSSAWSNMTNILENIKGNTVTMVSNFENLSLMLQYDALFLQKRDISGFGPIYDFSGSLSATEMINIKAFIDAGGRVLMIGEWGGWPYDSSIGWEKWDNQILSIVGGTYDTRYDSPYRSNLPTSITNSQLTKGVDTLGPNSMSYGTANGGKALFAPNIASLWGEKDNVLIVLDASLYSDANWNIEDNSQFAINTAEWLSHKKVPEPATMLLLGLGLFGLACLRKNGNKLVN